MRDVDKNFWQSLDKNKLLPVAKDNRKSSDFFDGALLTKNKSIGEKTQSDMPDKRYRGNYIEDAERAKRQKHNPKEGTAINKEVPEISEERQGKSIIFNREEKRIENFLRDTKSTNLEAYKYLKEVSMSFDTNDLDDLANPAFLSQHISMGTKQSVGIANSVRQNLDKYPLNKIFIGFSRMGVINKGGTMPIVYHRKILLCFLKVFSEFDMEIKEKLYKSLGFQKFCSPNLPKQVKSSEKVYDTINSKSEQKGNEENTAQFLSALSTSIKDLTRANHSVEKDQEKTKEQVNQKSTEFNLPTEENDPLMTLPLGPITEKDLEEWSALHLA